MNVMRPHPSQNRRKAGRNLNVFQTGLADRGGSSSSVQGVGSSTLSRLQWSNQRSSTLSTGDDLSVAQILSMSSAGRGGQRTSGIDTGLRSSSTGRSSGNPKNFEPAAGGYCGYDSEVNPLLNRNIVPVAPAESFFSNVSDNQNWDTEPLLRQSPGIVHPFSFAASNSIVDSGHCMYDGQEDGEFFSLSHVLQDENPPVEHQHDDEPPPLEPTAQPSTTSEDYFDLFKTPLPLSKGNSNISRSETEYESIFKTPSARALPRLSTPLFSSKSGSDLSTAYSRTTRSQSKTRTTKSLEPLVSSDSSVIVAITEGRGYAVGEVGLAFINLSKPILTLSQISDSQTYYKTLTKINLFNPIEIIVPDTFINDKNTSDLYKRVTEYFSSLKVVSVKRIYFNGEQGLELVRSLCLPEFSSVDVITLRKYYALAAATALLKYIEHQHSTVYAKHSIQVCYEAAKGIVALDVATARRLELVKTHGDMINPEKYSLLGIMDSTVTLGGKRRLRSEILQPPASRKLIEERLDVVSFLVANPCLLASLQGALVKFSTAEKLMWLCRKTPDFKQEKKANEIMTNYILLLKSSLENLLLLSELLNETENDFLLNIRDVLADQRYKAMGDLISQKIHHDAKLSKGYQGAEINRCFSIKHEVNSLLDVARSTYSNLVQEIQDLTTKLADEHNIPLRMGQSAELGFHGQYSLPKNSEIISADVPQVFTDVKIKGNVCHVSTDEMFSLNVRVRRAVQEIQLISNVVLFELIKELRPFIGCLYNLCENVAILDVLCSLAKYSMTANFVRPTFGDELDVKGGRHPVLDYMNPIKPTPNDTRASRNKNFSIVTGPNMSGKTIYLLQIALLQIMAQMGSYLPADSATFRITDHIYVRKDGSENIDNKASAFVVEVKELMYCLNTITNSSLIVLDEMCTGTNTEGGTAVAWAICEELLCRPAFTFLATHLHFLTNFDKLFVNVTNFHMEAIEVDHPGLAYGPLTNTHRLVDGFTQISNYGMRLMMTTSLPESMKNDAMNISEALSSKRSNCLALANMIPVDVQAVMTRVDKIEHFMKGLHQLSTSEEYSLDSIQHLQRSAVDNIIIEEMRSQMANELGTPPRSFKQAKMVSSENLEHEGESEPQEPQPRLCEASPEPGFLRSFHSRSIPNSEEPLNRFDVSLNGSANESQSPLDNDDCSDYHVKQGGASLGSSVSLVPRGASSCPSRTFTFLTYPGASTSPFHSRPSCSNASSSGFGFNSN